MTNHNNEDNDDDDTTTIDGDDGNDITITTTTASPGIDAESLASNLGGIDYSPLPSSGHRPSPVNDATSSLRRYGYSLLNLLTTTLLFTLPYSSQPHLFLSLFFPSFSLGSYKHS